MTGKQKIQILGSSKKIDMKSKDSTSAEVAWGDSRGAGRRWGLAGILGGALIGLLAFAPATWLAQGLAWASQNYILLDHPQGTLWSGRGVLVLTGGRDSRDASALPGRIEWNVGLYKEGFEIQLFQNCCLHGPLTLRIKPGWGRTDVLLKPSSTGLVAEWPSAWLSGLGTPWNTLQLEGPVRLSLSQLSLESIEGQWVFKGDADLDFLNISSRLSTRKPLGSYRLSVQGEEGRGEGTKFKLSTLHGALTLQGSGRWGPAGLSFHGEASTHPEDQAALQNLLNVIGRRDGSRSVISIGSV